MKRTCTLAMLVCLLSGCLNGEQAPTGAARPPVREPFTQPTELDDFFAPIPLPLDLTPEDQALLGGPSANIRLLKWHLPIETDDRDAWQLADTHALPLKTCLLWQNNGLRIGLLPFDRLKNFHKALEDAVKKIPVQPGKPTPTIQRTQGNARIGTWLLGIHEGAYQKNRRTTLTDLTLPPHLPVTEPLPASTNARARLLARVQPGPEGSTDLTLLPQHAFAEVAPLGEKIDITTLELRGHEMEALRSVITCMPGMLVVIGLDDTPRGDGPRLEHLLGWHLLASKRSGQGRRTLLILAPGQVESP